MTEKNGSTKECEQEPRTYSHPTPDLHDSGSRTIIRSDASTYIRKGYPNPSNHQLETGNGETSFLGQVAL